MSHSGCHPLIKLVQFFFDSNPDTEPRTRTRTTCYIFSVDHRSRLIIHIHEIDLSVYYVSFANLLAVYTDTDRDPCHRFYYLCKTYFFITLKSNTTGFRPCVNDVISAFVSARQRLRANKRLIIITPTIWILDTLNATVVTGDRRFELAASLRSVYEKRYLIGNFETSLSLAIL